MKLVVAIVGVILFLSLNACGTGTQGMDARIGTDATNSDAVLAESDVRAPDATLHDGNTTDVTPRADACADGTDPCDAGCTDLMSDPNNCGGCGEVCPANTTCFEGGCLCAGIATPCNDVCVDISSDPNNCGGCGNQCGDGMFCENRVCRTGTCGNRSQPCCSNGTCQAGFSCTAGSTCCTSAPTCAVVGATCAHTRDCCTGLCNTGHCACAPNGTQFSLPLIYADPDFCCSGGSGSTGAACTQICMQ